MKKLFLICSATGFILSCSKAPEVNLSYDGPIFELIPSQESGIEFKNNLQETSRINILTYDYFYNGGGVAIGDINNDGLADIYFSANAESNRLYLNKGNLKFEDITENAGVSSATGWKTGVTMADVNGDGYLDIYISKSGRYQAQSRRNELFINNGDLTFSERAEEYGLDNAGHSTQASFFDYDNDGDLDMYLLNHNVVRQNNLVGGSKIGNPYVSDKLFQNVNGKYIDVSKEVGLRLNSIGYGLGVSTGDLNNDGFTDLYVTNDYLEQDYMYFNTGQNSFREVIKEKTNHTSVFSMGCDIADINNDGRMDIVTADMVAEDNYRQKTNMASMNPEQFYMTVNSGFHYQYMINTLQLNNGYSFSEIGQLAGISNTDWSWATLFADFNNDGFKDLFISNGYRKDIANKDFVKLSEKKIGEARDNDYMLEAIEELLGLVPSTKIPNYVFENNKNLKFIKRTNEWGLDEPSFSNGAAYADLDNDGDLDLVINNIDDNAFLYKNLSSDNHAGNYLTVELTGPQGNSKGIGATIELVHDNQRIIYENYPCRGYQSSVDQKLTIGVGEWRTADRLIIKWPGNRTQEILSPKLNTLIKVDYSDSRHIKRPAGYPTRVFSEITNSSGINYNHKENEFDDFGREVLLPHRMSNFGPSMTVGDINGDGLEDFFVGGASGFSGLFYVQNSRGKFTKHTSIALANDSLKEDTGSLLFDFDNDQDLDLYVVSGGNEDYAANYYQDRLYINNGLGEFERGKLPIIVGSGSNVIPTDFNDDGFTDLFVCGRQSPGKYPYEGTSYLLENRDGKYFVDVTGVNSVSLSKVGMVTDAVFLDHDEDGDDDLIVVGEWMRPTLFINDNTVFKKSKILSKDYSGWWFSLAAGDFNNDEKVDIVAGNLGLNYKYKASIREPFQIYANDFDSNGSLDIVLSYFNDGSLYPLRGRQCSSQQMPFISEKFKNYEEFGRATLEDVYGEDLSKSIVFKAQTFASSIMIKSGLDYIVSELPIQAQFSSVNCIIVEDFNGDNNMDLVIAGNLFSSEVETTRNDASRGLLLFGNGDGSFDVLDASKSGVNLMYDTKDIKLISLASGGKGLLVANNQGPIQLLRINIGSPHLSNS